MRISRCACISLSLETISLLRTRYSEEKGEGGEGGRATQTELKACMRTFKILY